MKKQYDLALKASAAELDVYRILNETKLLHLHPHWFVEQAEERNQYLHAELRDYEDEQEFTLDLRIEVTDKDCTTGNGEHVRSILKISILNYYVKELCFFADQHKTGILVIYENDPLPEQEENILLWIRAIQEYLRMYTTTNLRTLFFRGIMNKMILRMNPSQRKICIMIAKITVIEILVILILVFGYVFWSK